MKTQITAIAIVVAAASLTACGPGDENNDNSTSNAATNSSMNSNSANSDTFEPAQATVEDGPGGEAECGSLGTGGDPADYGDILTVALDYDGADTAVMTITFAGDAQAKIAEAGGTKYSGYVQAEIGTTYPFAASTATGDFENSPNSLAESFSVEWTSNSEVEITISGFEEGGGPIVGGKVNTQSATQVAPDVVWCDEVEIAL